MARLQVKRSGSPTPLRFLDAIRTRLPGAWFSPSPEELISLYRLRYRMALEEKKFDTALVFLNRILEVDSRHWEARLLKAELYHRHLSDFSSALDQYNKLIRLSPKEQPEHLLARNNLAELMELVS